MPCGLGAASRVARCRRFSTPTYSSTAPTPAYAVWPVIGIDAALVEAAIQTSIQHRLSIWDAMVIEAATRAQAQVLYSEDLLHGQRFGSLTVVNPFKG